MGCNKLSRPAMREIPLFHEEGRYTPEFVSSSRSNATVRKDSSFMVWLKEFQTQNCPYE